MDMQRKPEIFMINKYTIDEWKQIRRQYNNSNANMPGG
jgi:hypothetical protein